MPHAMPYGLYVSAAGAEAQSRRLEVLSNNLANVDTPGFKRQLSILQARHSEAIERGEATPREGTINDIGGGVRFRETVTDFARGNLKATGVETDMAINSDDAFFVVDRDGDELLTRAGNFHFDSQGRLMTQQGYSVLSVDGEPVAIDASLPWRILESGVIEQPGSSVAIALSRPASMGDLARVGENYFKPLAPADPLPQPERQIRSGYLEQSSVRPTQAMMQLIEASRAYEANIKLVQNQDHMIGSLVNRVLRQS